MDKLVIKEILSVDLNVLTENGEHQIKYQDEDVQEILKSIAATK